MRDRLRDLFLMRRAPIFAGEPTKPNVKAGGRVKVLALAGNRPVPRDPWGVALPPGHQGPTTVANRVLAVRFTDGTVRDATSWMVVL